MSKEVQKEGFIIQGAYGGFTYIITGEEKVFDKRISPHYRWGAVELALRFAILELDSEIVLKGFAEPDRSSSTLKSITGGVNWWLNPYTRFSANYVHNIYEGKRINKE